MEIEICYFLGFFDSGLKMNLIRMDSQITSEEISFHLKLW